MSAGEGRYVCPDCGSTDLLQDAYVALNDPSDVRTLDTIDCDHCGSKDITPNERLAEMPRNHATKPQGAYLSDGGNAFFLGDDDVLYVAPIDMTGDPIWADTSEVDYSRIDTYEANHATNMAEALIAIASSHAFREKIAYRSSV